MKFLIFGRNGQVGSSLLVLLGADHEVIALDQDDLDLAQTSQIKAVIELHEPDWVINASAYTAVDRAEEDAYLADAINHLAPAAIAQACASISCQLLHYSTDYVFDGSGDRPYIESDQPNPKSVYGVTKLAGEQAVINAQPSAIILRTAWVYAEKGANFVNTMLRLANERDEISVVADQVGSPTLAFDLAKASVDLIEKIEREDLGEIGGVYHATGKGQTSWHGFAGEIFKMAGKTVKLHAITSEDYPTPAPRPKYSVLSNEKLMRVFNVELPSWQQSLEKTLR